MTGRAAPLYSVAMAPLDAVFVSWSNADGIGALRLSTGELLRVGMSACGFVPQVGLQVQVLEAAPHPLGGRKATRVGLPAGTDADALLDAAHPLPGLQGGAAALNRFIEETDGVGLLGVVLRAPLSGRVALRRWLGRAGLDVDFNAPRGPQVGIGKVPFRLEVVTAEVPFGRGVVSFCLPGPFSAKTERTQALARLQLEGTPVDALGAFSPLAAAVRALAAEEAAVIVHQAPGCLLESGPWSARLDAAPLGAWTHLTAQRGMVILSGLRGVMVPDLFTEGDDPVVAGPALQQAAAELVAMVRAGKLPKPGDLLAGKAVLEASDAWVRLAPALA